MVIFTSTPRFAALSSALVMTESPISSFSIARLCFAELITVRMAACELVGDHTRSAPSGGVIFLCAKSALNVATTAATSASLVSMTAKSLVPA